MPDDESTTPTGPEPGAGDGRGDPSGRPGSADHPLPPGAPGPAPQCLPNPVVRPRRRGRRTARCDPRRRPDPEYAAHQSGRRHHHDDHPSGGPGRHLPADRHAGARGARCRPGPALAFKIGNYTDDRPSAGLNQADIVFEEPVEGSYTRLVAVFQCQGSALVGDLRSAREPDVAILSQLSNPIFLHAGGIDPVLALLTDAPIQDKNVLQGGFGSVTIPSARPLRPLRHVLRHRPGVGPRPGRRLAARPDLHLLPGPAGRVGAGVGDRRPHPLLLHVRRDLDVEPGHVDLPPLVLRACPTSWSTAARRRPTTSSS